jgi:hypothetical protein
MRAGGLAATLGMTLALGCSLRNLDDLSAGAPPADANAPLSPDAAADTAAPDAPAAPADLGNAGTPDTTEDVAVASARTIFWVDSGNRGVHSATSEGNDARRLVMLPMSSFLRSIAADTVHQKIYFSDSGLKKIQRANFDGTTIEDLFTGLDAPVGLDLDVAAGKIYFADQGAQPTIFRANLDGTGKEAIITAGIMHPYGLALDRAGGRVYFVDNGLNAVLRAGLDGSGLQKLPIAGLAAPIEMALDAQGGKIYWSDLGPPPRIRGANLDGSGAEDVINQTRSPTLSTPLGVAVDVLARKLYWVDGGGGSLDVIQRAELDGSAIHPVVLGLSAPRGMALGY